MWLIQFLTSRTMKNAYGIPVRNFGRIEEGLYRGALPSEEGYQALVETLGVRSVCNIIEGDRSDDRRRALEAGVREWIHIPFSDEEKPHPACVRAWLNFARSPEVRPAFMSCKGGRHRSGVLVGVYRVTDCGWTKAKAYEEMTRHGWYADLGHRPLLDWFFKEFDPADYREHRTAEATDERPS